MSPIFRADRSVAAASTTRAIMRDQSRSRNTTKRRTAPTRRTSSRRANGVPNGIADVPLTGARRRGSEFRRPMWYRRIESMGLAAVIRGRSYGKGDPTKQQASVGHPQARGDGAPHRHGKGGIRQARQSEGRPAVGFEEL